MILARERPERQKGFTLIELLVVIAIIALLASVILVSASAARARGRDGKRIADMNQFAKALELYFNDNYGYPTSSPATGVLLSTSNVSGMVPKYLTQMPVSPEPADGGCSDLTGNAGYPALNNSYWYQSDSSGPGFATKYTLTFCLGAGLGGSLTSGAHYLAGGALH